MELFCSGCEKITDAGFQSLLQNLPNFVFLRKIDFDFNQYVLFSFLIYYIESCDITDDGFCDFGKILQSLPLLESLSFKCSESVIKKINNNFSLASGVGSLVQRCLK